MTHTPSPTDIVIIAAARTPMGGLQGSFATLSASDLGGVALAEALKRSGLGADQVDEVLMGNVLLAGQGQAPARQAARKAGISDSAGATTLNKMCGSGMKAIMLAHDLIKAGSADVVAAGGMESMSNAPYLISKARSGYRLGHGELKDCLFLDGLEDAYEPGRLMGSFAESCAEKFGFNRGQQDEFALRSLQLAQQAIASGAFSSEIAPVAMNTRQGTVQVEIDEQPGQARPDKIPTLKPVFKKDGTITAANASSISDGAAALILTSRSKAEALGATILARVVAHTTHAQEPAWFSTAPIGAIEKLFARTGWQVADVDLFEINEAFAVVTMAAASALSIPMQKINTRGGACALGHPIGASGARIVVTLLYALQQQNLQRGVAALCIGGGEATALAIERE